MRARIASSDKHRTWKKRRVSGSVGRESVAIRESG